MGYEIVGIYETEPEIAILCPRIQVTEIQKHYYDPYLKDLRTNVMVCDLYKDPTKKKTSAADIKEYLNDLIPHLLDAEIDTLVVTQPDYFKIITKQGKTDATVGDILDTIVPGLQATYCPNYSRVFYDPDKMKAKIKLSLETLVKNKQGNTVKVGSDIIKFCAYPETDQEILDWLDKLYEMDCDLTCDIEGFSLKHYDAGIGTITFCWDQHHGVAFPIDYQSIAYDKDVGHHGTQITNPVVRRALKIFFEVFKNKMIYHNICYDVYVLIYQLFMEDILDQEGLLYGLEVMLRNWDCSQLVTYLATNSCAGNELGLKIQAQEFAGNYAVEDIKDIRKIPMKDLLKYNLIDGLSTWYVYDKNYPIMIADDQMSVYQAIFRPAVIDIIQMQLTGMPINMDKVVALEKLLQGEATVLEGRMLGMDIVDSFMDTLKDELVIKKNDKLKTKQITRADLGKTKDTMIDFNPGSPKQLQRLLYSEDFLGLPVLDYTDTKQPATGAETLDKLKHHTKDPEVLEFLDVLIEHKASAIILSTFLPAFLLAKKGRDGWHYLFGNFRLGGTASGRLSSNNPNLQNIPSAGSSKVKQRLAKLIKECFEAPPAYWKIDQNMLQNFITTLKQSLKGA